MIDGWNRSQTHEEWAHNRLSFFEGEFYKLALTDCETIFEVNLFVSEGV